MKTKQQTLIEKVNSVKDLYFLASAMFYSQCEDTILPELSLLCNKETFVDILSHFGGKTIKIPTIEEFKNIMNEILIFYELNYTNKDKKTIIKELGITESQLVELRDKAIKHLGQLDMNFVERFIND